MDIEVPSESVFGESQMMKYHYRWLIDTLRTGGCLVNVNDSLQMIGGTAFNFCINGEFCAIDCSDWITLNPKSWKYKHWFKQKFVRGHEARPSVHSLAASSFKSWEAYYQLEPALKYVCSGDTVVHRQIIAEPLNAETRNQRTRRSFVRKKLVEALGDRVLFNRVQQPIFWEECSKALVYVHVPGIWEHAMDRAQVELMAFGVCVLCPDIFIVSCSARPEPWVHFVPMNDANTDVVEKVRWCENHREECVAIGVRAKEWFKRNASPDAVVRHIEDCLEI